MMGSYPRGSASISNTTKGLHINQNDANMSTGAITINSPIEQGHPADVLFGDKELSKRQQDILDQLPSDGDEVIVDKKAV